MNINNGFMTINSPLGILQMAIRHKAIDAVYECRDGKKGYVVELRGGQRLLLEGMICIEAAELLKVLSEMDSPE